MSELCQHQWDVPALRHVMDKVLPENKPFESFEIEDNFPVLGRRVFNLNARKISQPGNHAPPYVCWCSRTSPTASSASAMPWR